MQIAIYTFSSMIDQHAALMITVLRRDYPEIAESISEKINRSMPEQTLEDLSKIEQIRDIVQKRKGHRTS